ncbi:hypothetical protein TNCV_3750671 [Trichonephila clavipes]|nr:hypothetical protein TNCV_3750671 [Trichonephila clavipes]
MHRAVTPFPPKCALRGWVSNYSPKRRPLSEHMYLSPGRNWFRLPPLLVRVRPLEDGEEQWDMGLTFWYSVPIE